MADSGSSALLPKDNIRTAVAAAIALLTAGGWLYALVRPEQRDALPAQNTIWWIEQIVGLALVVVCIGIVVRKRSFFRPAVWLTGYSLLFDVMRWLLGYSRGTLVIPIGLVMYALLLWRLRLTRQAMTEPSSSMPPA
ncbi:MAG TPA: hypothetical protein VNO75_01355 [Gemmatimonadaceae bacterium]|nr:hypothetical protein [Gemmatimonadaceae bacterium]